MCCEDTRIQEGKLLDISRGRRNSSNLPTHRFTSTRKDRRLAGLAIWFSWFREANYGSNDHVLGPALWST